MSPLEPKTIMLHGRRARYLQVGNGPPLLLIHGFAGTLENKASAICSSRSGMSARRSLGTRLAAASPARTPPFRAMQGARSVG
ncbi:MAG: hypothetical protein ABSB69_15585 [Solirubrobacteraceae bacterium]